MQNRMRKVAVCCVVPVLLLAGADAHARKEYFGENKGQEILTPTEREAQYYQAQQQMLAELKRAVELNTVAVEAGNKLLTQLLESQREETALFREMVEARRKKEGETPGQPPEDKGADGASNNGGAANNAGQRGEAIIKFMPPQPASASPGAVPPGGASPAPAQPVTVKPAVPASPVTVQPAVPATGATPAPQQPAPKQ